MKQVILVMLIALTGLAASCETTDRGVKKDVNTQLVNWYNDAAINGAIVAQHTLYPYHFVANGAALNELGERDVDVLAAHYKEHPGNLSVRQGDVAAALYEARVNTVVERMVQAGVEKERISISDALPGGDGMISEHVLTVLERAQKKPTSSLGGAGLQTRP